MYPRHLVCCGLVAKTVWVTCSKSEPNTFADTHYKSSRLPQVIYVIITHRLMTGKVTTTANNYVDPSRSGIYISCVTPHASRHNLQSQVPTRPACLTVRSIANCITQPINKMHGASQSQLRTAGTIFPPTSYYFNAAVQSRVRTQSNKPGQYADHHTPRSPVH